jgi:DNA-binding NtrC family response regulator
MAHDWPGNVRQLENAVYRAIVLSDAPYLQPHDFPAVSGLKPPVEAAPAPSAGAAAAVPSAQSFLADMPKEAPVRILDERGHLRTLEDIEHDLIQLAIEIYSGHMSEVARRLGIGRSTLYRKVREQGLDGAPEDGEDEEASEAA